MSEESLISAAPTPEEASKPATKTVAEEPTESFGDAFAEFQRSHQRKAEDGSKQIDATVVAIDAENVVLDIGFKTEGILVRTSFPNNADDVKVGDHMLVSVRGRSEGFYELSRIRVVQPTDWSSLQKAFDEKTP